MASGITFSGFNNIDFGSILSLVMEQERQPLTVLESRKTALETQKTAFATFATKLAALQTAAADLADADTTAALTATSSDATVVGVTSTTGSVAGSYDLVVSDIAKAQVTVSETSYSSVNAVVGTNGTFVVAGADAESTIEIDLDGSMTLSQLASRINRDEASPVSASVVRVGLNDYRLVLTAKNTGYDNVFTVEVTEALSGGTGLAFHDEDENGIAGDSQEDNVQNAANAVVTVNNLRIESGSNTIEDVVPGTTLTLLRKSADSVRVDVARDQDQAVEAVKKFVTAYNDVMTFIKNQNTDQASGKAGIGRDTLVRSLRDSLRATVGAAYGTGAVSHLANVGVAVDRNGVLQIDEDKLRDVLDASPDAVATLLAGDDGESGFSGALDKLLNDYTRSGGLVSDARERLTAQVSSLSDRLSAMEQQLARRRLTLQQEFAAADRAMSQLNSQGSSLSALSSQYRLF